VGQDDAIRAMMSAAANLPVADTAAEVVVRLVRTSLAATVRRLAVGRPREQVLQEVTWRR